MAPAAGHVTFDPKAQVFQLHRSRHKYAILILKQPISVSKLHCWPPIKNRASHTSLKAPADDLFTWPRRSWVCYTSTCRERESINAAAEVPACALRLSRGCCVFPGIITVPRCVGYLLRLTGVTWWYFSRIAAARPSGSRQLEPLVSRWETRAEDKLTPKFDL